MSGYRKVYAVENLDGGLNNKYNRTFIDDSESPDALNVVFDDVGSVATREGFAKFNTTSVGSFAGDGVFATRFNNGNSTMLAWWNGSMYQAGTLNTFTTVPSAQSVFTAGTRVDAHMFQNLMFFGNGGSVPYKYNGTDFTRMGVEVPNSLPTVATSSAGVLSGAYAYKIAYENSYVVWGDVSSATTTINVAGGVRVLLTSLPVAPQSYGVAKRRIYRTTTSGTTFLFVATVADNSTTTYEDNIADGSLGAGAPTDNGLPPNWKYARIHQQRVWCVEDVSNPQRLWYSDLGNPYVFASTNYLQIDAGDGEKITGIGIHGNSIVIYKEASIWINYMEDTTPSNWVLVKTNSKYGGASHYSITDYKDKQLFIGQRYGVIAGMFAFKGVGVSQDAVRLDTVGMYSDAVSDRIEPDVLTYNKSYTNLSCAIEFENKVWVGVPYDTSTSNNRVYQFDFMRVANQLGEGSWIPFTGINPACFVIFNNKLYFQSDTANGRVYQLEAGVYNDDGAAIDSYFWTKVWSGHKGDEDWHKDWRWIELTIGTLGNWMMDVAYRLDDDDSVGSTKTVSLDPGGSLWGTMIWGTDVWGGGTNRAFAKVYFATSTGKRIQIKFANQNVANQAFKVIRMSLYYNKRGIR